MAALFANALPARTVGENGAPSYTVASVGSSLLSFFFKLVRGLERDSLKEFVQEALAEKSPSVVADLFVLAMQTRDVRGGKGERELSHYLLLELCRSYPNTVLAMVPLLPEFGSWKDLKLIAEHIETDLKTAGDSETAAHLTNLKGALLRAFAKQLQADSVKEGKGISLCAKWAPREGRHFNRLAKELAALMFPEDRAALAKYRKLVAGLTKKLDVVETHMAGNTWSEIDPAAVPARCLKLSRHAFRNEVCPFIQQGKKRARNPDAGKVRYADRADRIACAATFISHTAKARTSPEEAKVHGATLHPHELVKVYIAMIEGSDDSDSSDSDSDDSDSSDSDSSDSDSENSDSSGDSDSDDKDDNVTKGKDDDVIESQWIDLVTRFRESGVLGSMIPLVDVSGSMDGEPLEVAIALGLLVAETTHEALRGRMITFHRKPTWHLPVGDSLRERVASTLKAPFGLNTDFETAMNLIFVAVTTHNIPAADVGAMTLLVLSDMQFDEARGARSHTWETHHERMTRQWNAAGLPLPRIVYWNLRGDTKDFVATAETPGVSMLSGFSHSLLKLFMEGKVDVMTNPLTTLRAVLDVPRYNAVREVCQSVGEGLLAHYIAPIIEAPAKVPAPLGGEKFESVSMEE